MRSTLIALATLSATLFSSESSADDVARINALLARRTEVYVELKENISESKSGLASLDAAMSDLSTTSLKFDSYNEESDELTLTIVRRSGEEKVVAKRNEVIALATAKQAEAVAQQAVCLEGQVNCLPCLLEGAIKSYRIGKALSFFTSLAITAGTSGGGAAAASVSVW